MKKAFTLLETLIVIVIIGILAVVLVESYTTVSGIAFRIQQEKHLSEESLMLTQMLQSISDTAAIDYEKYDGGLEKTFGFTETLYLTWEQWSGASISSSGGCLDIEGSFSVQADGTYGDVASILSQGSWCQLILSHDGVETPLLATNKLVVSKVVFRVIPFDSEINYFSDKYEDKILINDVAKPAFWIFLHLYSPRYQPIWKNNIDQSLQLFFNLNG